jgi:hypothetical protein
MKFFVATLSLLVLQDHSASAQRPDVDDQPCLANVLNGLELESCDARSIIQELSAKFDSLPSCEWSFGRELLFLTGLDSRDGIALALETLCEDARLLALDDAPLTAWEEIHEGFTQSFLEQYVDGGTYLNLETGNFQNPDGSNPMEDGTTPESYYAGVAIDDFYQDGATTTILEDVAHLSQCQNQAIMCCFGRDRQYDDNNGACREDRCDNRPPGDNTNICYDPIAAPPTPFPEDERAHCHGFLWAEDEDDPSNLLKFNNFFYVLMHDHMYTRGYVESVGAGIPMCECIEEMPVVLRADCSEVSLEETIFTLTYSAAGGLGVTSGALEFSLNSCRGVYPDSTGEYVGKGNDLASMAYKLFLDGKMDLATRNNVFAHLAGHAEEKKPEDKENEAICELAWDDATQGQDYYPSVTP